jgi:hypothetical protein
MMAGYLPTPLRARSVFRLSIVALGGNGTPGETPMILFAQRHARLVRGGGPYGVETAHILIISHNLPGNYAFSSLVSSDQTISLDQMAETSPTKDISFQQLAVARRSTQAVSDFLEKQLLGYLDTLRSLLLPDRVLGKFAGSKFEVPGAEKALTELQENYRRLPNKPFDFPKEFETDWLGEVGAKLDVQRWEYYREISTEFGKRTILITSPTRWVLAYGPGYSVSQAIRAFAQKQDRRGTDQLRQFVINTLVMQSLIARSGGLSSILAELRYDVTTGSHPAFSGLPAIVIQSQIPTFLPPEPIIAAATDLSGVDAFIELIDVESIRQLSDPFKQRISELIPQQP